MLVQNTSRPYLREKAAALAAERAEPLSRLIVVLEMSRLKKLAQAIVASGQGLNMTPYRVEVRPGEMLFLADDYERQCKDSSRADFRKAYLPSPYFIHHPEVLHQDGDEVQAVRIQICPEGQIAT